MRNIVGNVVEGPNFFDREHEQKLAWQYLEIDNLLLAAPRRIGKTSLMRQLVTTANAHQYTHAIEVSFADCSDELRCMLAILKAIKDKLPTGNQILESLKEKFKKIKNFNISADGLSWTISDNTQPNWRDVGESITETLSKLNGKVLICADEVPLFILHSLLDHGSENGQKRARNFLNWFRNLRQRYSQDIRWVIAGSIGLDTIAQRFGFSDTINDLRAFQIGAFTPASADQFLQKLGESENLPLEKGIRNAILTRLDWPLPYYLQVVFSELHKQFSGATTKLSTTDVDTIFEELLSPVFDNYFNYWRQRLEDELGQPDANYAIALLDHIAKAPNGTTDTTLSLKLDSLSNNPNDNDKLYRFLIGVLKRDGYIVESHTTHHDQPIRRWYFQLSLLRNWWQRQ